MNMIKRKLAMAPLALALITTAATQSGHAAETFTESQTEQQNTFWGVGIGSLLGAVLAGPPGAAIGGALGGSVGWGKDQLDAREDAQEAYAQYEQALSQQQQKLESKLRRTEAELHAQQSRQAEQLARLKALQEKQNDNTEEQAFLKKLVRHYAQDIYFRVGQSAAPEDTGERLSNLVDLLKAHPDLQVSLKGYTDQSGSAKLNAAIAQARVDSIKQALQDQGIEKERIMGMAIGEVPALIPAQTEHLVSDNILLEELQEGAEPQPLTVNIPLKKRNPVLDRRVAIELTLPEKQKPAESIEQTLVSLSGGEK